MGRLIEADKFQESIKDIYSDCTDDEDIVTSKDELLSFIDDEPTVNAIPVKWLESYINKNNPDDEENDPWTYYAYAFLTNWLNEPHKGRFYETD